VAKRRRTAPVPNLVPDIRPDARRLCEQLTQHAQALAAWFDRPDSAVPVGTIGELIQLEYQLGTIRRLFLPPPTPQAGAGG
jgi:hypothetical protein